LVGASTLRLDRFLSPTLGLLIPVSFSFSRIGVEPELITGSDVRGASLVGLRRPASHVTAMQLSAARTIPGGSFLVRTLVNPLRVSANWSSSGSVTEYNEADSRNWGLAVSWDKQLAARGPGLGLGGLVGRLPRWLAQSAAGRGTANARLNLVPSQLQFTSELSHTVGHVTSFTVPIERLADTLLIPTENLQHLWRNASNVNWEPLGMLSLAGNWQSTRDLRMYPDSTPLGRLAGQSRRSMLGLDVGTERDRNITSSITLAPNVASWFRPRLTTVSNFTLSRSLTARNPVRVDGDTAGAYILPQTLNNARTNELGFTLEPATLARQLFGDSSGAARALVRMRPIDASWGRTFSSTFDLAAFDPGTSYQLAIGGFGSFLEQDDTRAVGASEIHTGRVTGTIELPVGLSADIRYGHTTADRYQRTANDHFILARSEQLDWPDASLNWSRSFRGGPLTLVALTGAIRKREVSTSIPAADSTTPAALSATNSSNYRPGMRLFFRNNISITANANIDRGETVNNGNVTERRSDGWDTTVEWSVRLPFGSAQTRKPLRTALFAQGFNQRECLVQAGSGTCSPIADIRRTTVSGTMTTDIVGEGVGTGAFSIQYVLNDFRHLDRRTSTLSIGLALRMPLSTFGGI
jgi:hypothetical protein